MSEIPEIGGRKPMVVNAEAGKSYWWCACGKSQKQPFCDGSHKGSEFSPLEYKAEAAGETYWWCRCGRSQSQPFCDGSHEGTGIEPMEWKANRSGMINFCTCKRTARPPICDNTHLKL